MTILATARIMVSRTLASPGIIWTTGCLPVLVLILTPVQMIPGRLVSVAAFLPSVFLLTGWTDSRERNGLTALLFRTQRLPRVRYTEIALPALGGAVLSSLVALLVKFPPPWQFWPASLMTSLAGALLLFFVEKRVRFIGRSMAGLLWIAGISGGTGRSAAADLLPSDYPGRILEVSGSHGSAHPDTLLVASMVFLAVCATLFTLYESD